MRVGIARYDYDADLRLKIASQPIPKLNKKGQNAKISANILSDDEMRANGFTNRIKTEWSYTKHLVKPDSDISLYISIPKNNPSDISIDVLDDLFCQPYDYQHLLDVSPENEFAFSVYKEVEHCMKLLTDAGIITGHEMGAYI